MRQYIFVMRELVTREVKRRYARSYLGVLWSVLDPLLNMAVMSLIFSAMFRRNIENYPIYLLTGRIFWALFTEATNSAMTALVNNKNMLIKVKLPMEIFPLSRSVTALVNFGYSTLAYLLMLIVFRIKFNRYMLLLPVFAGGIFLFAVGLGYVLSVLYVFFGDVQHLYSVLLTLWMYLSALFYPISSTPLLMQKVIRHNPIYNYIACARKCVLEGAPPTVEEWARVFVWSVGMYIVGKMFFKKQRSKVLQKV